jgi:hypothetical protein
MYFGGKEMGVFEMMSGLVSFLSLYGPNCKQKKHFWKHVIYSPLGLELEMLEIGD